MAWEAQNIGVTMLLIEGAPEGVVFIADPHLKETNIDRVRRVIDEINALDPSLVLIGGDFANGRESDFAIHAVWSGIDAPVYAVLGNHDYCAGINGIGGLQKMTSVAGAEITACGYDVGTLREETTDTEFADRLVATLERNGVRVLRNEYVELTYRRAGRHDRRR